MKTTITRTIAAAGVAAAALLSPLAIGSASAAPAGDPSACLPANHTAAVTPDRPSAGHTHYRVTITANPGSYACTLSGSPTGVSFASAGGAPLGVSAEPTGDQGAPVPFAPGAPVYFDIQVPTSAGPAQAAQVGYFLEGPDGVVPGESVAYGPLGVDAGTQVGPIQPGF